MTSSMPPTCDSTLGFAGARIDITPPDPVPMAGVEDRQGAWRAIETPLEANALVLDDGGVRTLWVAADLLYFGPELVDALQARASAHGLPGAHLVLAASHTHFAPATDRSKPRLGPVDAAYAEFVRAQLCRLVDDVLGAPTVPVHVEHARAEARHINVNRRRRWPLPTLTREGITLPPALVMAPAPDAPRDAHLDALRFVDAEGRIRGVAWKFACHPVCFPESDRVCSEYPGHARAALRQRLGSTLPVVFLQGFTGDVRPWLTNAAPTLKDRLRALRCGPGFGEVSMPQWKDWAGRIAALLCDAVGERVTNRFAGPLTIRSVDLPITQVIDLEGGTADQQRPLRIQKIGFAGGPSLLFVAAEVCSPYLARFGAAEELLCVGYTGHVFGYLPSQAQAKEGGYEGGSFFARFGLQGRWRPGFEEAVVAAVAGLNSPAGPAETAGAAAGLASA